MMRPWLLAFLPIVFCPALAAQSAPSKPESPEVCVAEVANASAVSAELGRMTERLVAGLKRNKITAAAMDSRATMNRRLQPTRENSGEADAMQCGYIVLTRIVENRAHPAALPTQRPGGPIVPSVDASDTMGGNSGPAYREEMQIDFALFRVSRADPLVDTSILERASGSVSDTFQSAMDRVASRVSHELKKSNK